MDYKNAIRHTASAATILCAISFAAMTTIAQEPTAAKKPVVSEKTAGRDPFRKYQPVIKTKMTATKLEPPTIQVRIDRYRAQKLAAASAHVAPPKPTTALLLNEMQVVGIFRTPRGWAAMIEATPIKLSYVLYPGETFFDGQLVAIEETRLVFRRDIVWTDGRREKTVEVKPLRQPNPVGAMTNVKASYADVPTAESEKRSDESPAVPNRLSREQIDIAIRQTTVLIGMDMQDVSRAWGDRHTNDSLVENDLAIQIWRYSRGEVYFRNGVVYKITLLKG